ncbi:MAG: class I tRNA ligase family protein, partial [Bacteriovoracaceae bacterium]|nr:class I tRNA ligase family protein [Bacteriovoracaceae bacterium]
MSENELQTLQEEVKTVFSRLKRPKKAVVTAGMPYANGPLHIGHLAGAHVPADIYARWLRLLINKENVLFVCGTDDHGSTSEVAAKTLGVNTKQFIDEIHSKQTETMNAYSISLDTYTGTSREENIEAHKSFCQEFLRKLYDNNMLEKKSSEQWFDTELSMFLPDRYVFGTCPNSNCENEKAYSEECDVCGSQYDPKELQNPKSTVSKSTPVLKETEHWWLDMWKVSDQLKE